MSGSLHGFDASTPGNAVVTPLQFRFLRTGETNWYPIYQRATAMGAKVELVLSDLWRSETHLTRVDDEAQWAAFVKSVADKAKALDANVMWDVWNEPNITKFWTGTQEQYFATYCSAVGVIKQELGENAIVGGPSETTTFNKPFVSAFLTYAAAHRCEVNFLSWHELVDTDHISEIADHVSDARKSFVDNPAFASLHIAQIQVNEFGGEATHMNPGALVAYLDYLEQARVDFAARTCWPTEPGGGSNCENALDGLISVATSQPRSVWWVQKFYADGVASRVRSTTALAHVVALGSSRSGTSGEAQVLLAYYGKPGEQNARLENVSLELDGLDTLGLADGTSVRFQVLELPDTETASLKTPVSSVAATAGVAHGRALISLEHVSLNSAYVISIERK